MTNEENMIDHFMRWRTEVEERYCKWWPAYAVADDDGSQFDMCLQDKGEDTEPVVLRLRCSRERISIVSRFRALVVIARHLRILHEYFQGYGPNGEARRKANVVIEGLPELDSMRDERRWELERWGAGTLPSFIYALTDDDLNMSLHEKHIHRINEGHYLDEEGVSLEDASGITRALDAYKQIEQICRWPDGR